MAFFLMTFFSLCDNIIIMKEIVNLLIKNGYEAYIVGGFVRDYLLGIKTKDIDISTNAPISKIKKIFNGRGRSFDKYFAYHINENGYSYDITTYRKELKYKKNKPCELEVASDLKTDLLRRDFTINTFALDENGRLVDLLDAKKDLNGKLIKVVGNTNKKFSQDKTRILRAIRFACTLDFELDKEIIDFITKRKTYLLNEVPKEFIKEELDKIFDSERYDKFFYLLKRYNISKHFDISFDLIKKSYNKYGVWAQIETSLPFKREERTIINGIKELIYKGDIDFVDFDMFNEVVICNAVSILGLEEKYKAFLEIKDLHSVIDIDADLDLFDQYLSFTDIKKVYKQVERMIMEGHLNNDKESIRNFLRNI